MEHATLAGFLTGNLSPEVLANEITAEANACNASFRAGENGYIIITDGPAVEVTREGARRLLAALDEERLPFELANYVADCHPFALVGNDWRNKKRDDLPFDRGYIRYTLEAAIWCVCHTDNFDDAVLLAANLGGDADTVAAVAGQIAGAIYGASGIRPAWRERIAWSPLIHALGLRLLH